MYSVEKSKLLLWCCNSENLSCDSIFFNSWRLCWTLLPLTLALIFFFYGSYVLKIELELQPPLQMFLYWLNFLPDYTVDQCVFLCQHGHYYLAEVVMTRLPPALCQSLYLYKRQQVGFSHMSRERSDSDTSERPQRFICSCTKGWVMYEVSCCELKVDNNS